MTNDINIYSSLLIYSALSGIFLRIIYDVMNVLKQRIISSLTSAPRFIRSLSQSRKDNVTSGSSAETLQPRSDDNAPQPLQNTATVKSVVKALSPTPNRGEIAASATVDILFSLICAFTVTLLLFGLNFGEMRWFVLPVTAAGYFLYGATVGIPIRAILSLILSVTARIISAISRLLLRPLVKISCSVQSKISKIAHNHRRKKLQSKPKHPPKRNPKRQK